MKRLVIAFVIPLTMISLLGLTKWWYVDVIDGTDGIMYGFPLIYKSWGFHTSMSNQYFCLEFLFDLLCHFAFWTIVFYLIKKAFKTIKAKKAISLFLYTIAGLIVILEMLFVVDPINLFKIKRNFDVEVIETGYSLFWQNVQRQEKE
ncbi:hypothetical protein [Flavobacterium sp. MDT1-60]|uniref:hypothetical protein n=1 Tax=Flavobacterium sp. MDT1-60 TaxID=1979344 RepID=UPI00177FB329|nr:hypothetical protein [Flavobacterium sp. MDT1-60]QOG01406.1 hypothetical protein IHE43_16550 [Flavobacterium sp. MDT1-60]